MGSRQSSLNVLNRDDSHPSRRGTTTNPREGVDCRSDLQVLSLLPTASRRPVRAFLPFLRVRICLFQFIFALTSVQLPRETCIISRNTCAGAWPTRRRRQGTPFALTRVHFDKDDIRIQNFTRVSRQANFSARHFYLLHAHNNSAVALARYATSPDRIARSTELACPLLSLCRRSTRNGGARTMPLPHAPARHHPHPHQRRAYSGRAKGSPRKANNRNWFSSHLALVSSSCYGNT